MTASRGLRARRSDAGRLVVTHRDLAALTFAGEQYGVPLDLFAEVMAAPLRVTRRRVGVLERAGLVRRDHLLGWAWVVPTRRGLEFAGLPYDVWEPVGWKLAHVAGVARLRRWLEGDHPGGRWHSERALRRYWSAPERKGARTRIADGALVLADRPMIGVELELHRKAAHLYGRIVSDVDPRFTEVWWFTPDPGWLERTLPAGEVEHYVFAVPDGVVR